MSINKQVKLLACSHVEHLTTEALILRFLFESSIKSRQKKMEITMNKSKNIRSITVVILLTIKGIMKGSKHF